MSVRYTDADWETLKNQIVTFMQASPEKSVLSLDDARALDEDFQNERVFNQACSDLGLFIVPVGGPE